MIPAEEPRAANNAPECPPNHLKAMSEGDVGEKLRTAAGDHTDFYAGISHATHVGKLFRPDTPLLPSGPPPSAPPGFDVRRPNGQRKRPAEAEPGFGPSRNLDYELELMPS